MLVLGIESTCDETGCSVVKDGKTILSNVISSQVKLHQEFGGVVPELACRQHIDVFIPVLDKALKDAGIALKDIDLIAVAHAPGLIGAVLLGLNVAKALSVATKKPFIGVNHVEAHLYASIMSHDQNVEFPALGVVLSGGHTALILMKNIGDYQLIGETTDDAIGEAFDKVAKMMQLPYPGGPQIERLATKGDPYSYSLKAGTVKGRPLDFSLSGLKTAVLYNLKGQNATKFPAEMLTESEKCNMAATFQRVILEDVVKKTLKAAEIHQCETLIFGGGVTNNQALRKIFSEKTQAHQLLWPSPGLSLDNAAMIAGLGYHQYQQRNQGSSLNLEAESRVSF
ncbi:MAG: tRNA (adenosine(37)-N6)-threonylcarbamoyltransferase complex transferase subunit TsaD [Chlamydiota bacterium]